MPQNQAQVLAGKNPTNVPVPLNTDAGGNLGTAQSAAGAPAQPHLDSLSNVRVNPMPPLTALNVHANTVIKASPGRIGKVSVVVAGSTAGGLYDCLTTDAAVAGTKLAHVPALTTDQIGVLAVDMVCAVGITYLAGTGQTVAISYE